MKMNRIIYYIMVFLLAGSVKNGFSQGMATDALVEQQAFTMALPPIQTILDSAMKHSPLLHLNRLEYEQAIIGLEEVNKQWMDYFHLEGTARYGLLNHLTISQLDTEEAASYGLLTQNEQLNYYAGVSFKFPVSEFFNRSIEKRKVKLELQLNQAEQMQIRDEIRKKVIGDYYLLKYYQERLNSFQEVLQTIEISYLDAQKALKKGQLKLNEFANISESRGKAKDDYLKAMNEYYAQYRILEVVIGTTMKEI